MVDTMTDWHSEALLDNWREICLIVCTPFYAGALSKTEVKSMKCFMTNLILGGFFATNS